MADRLGVSRPPVKRAPALLGISTYVQDLFYGGALIVAVALSQLVRSREERLT